MIDRREFLRLSGGSLAFAAAGCSRSRFADPDVALRLTYPLDSWDFRFRDDSTQFLLFLPLVARGATGELEPRLAVSWEHSRDFRTWTVRIRDDVLWHDGQPVTAHDIAFTLDLLTHPDVGMAAPGGQAIEVVDDTTYTIEYRHQRADEVGKGSPLDDYTVYYPRHLLEPLDRAGFESWDFWSDPVGNGPYRFVRQMPLMMMEFEANPGHVRDRPRIDRIVLKFTPGGSDVAELLSGDVDAIGWAAPPEIEALSGDPRFRAYHDIGYAHDRVLAWNLRDPSFIDPRVRRALTLAIDRAELHGVLGLPGETPIFDVPLSSGQFFRREIPTPLPHDPETAMRLARRGGLATHALGRPESGRATFPLLPAHAGLSTGRGRIHPGCPASRGCRGRGLDDGVVGGAGARDRRRIRGRPLRGERVARQPDRRVSVLRRVVVHRVRESRGREALERALDYHLSERDRPDPSESAVDFRGRPAHPVPVSQRRELHRGRTGAGTRHSVPRRPAPICR